MKDPKKALRAKAATPDRSSPDPVGDAESLALAADADDLKTVRKRATEPDLGFEEVVANLRRERRL